MMWYFVKFIFWIVMGWQCGIFIDDLFDDDFVVMSVVELRCFGLVFDFYDYVIE